MYLYAANFGVDGVGSKWDGGSFVIAPEDGPYNRLHFHIYSPKTFLILLCFFNQSPQSLKCRNSFWYLFNWEFGAHKRPCPIAP
jgi:hypothetical protein